MTCDNRNPEHQTSNQNLLVVDILTADSPIFEMSSIFGIWTIKKVTAIYFGLPVFKQFSVHS